MCTVHHAHLCCRFLAGTEPTLVFSAVVARRHVTVELFMLQHDNVTYFFVQVRAMLV
jgi:hypothetical protein